MTRQPLTAYPHLQPTPGAPLMVTVHIAQGEINVMDSYAHNVWPSQCAYVLYKTDETRSRPTRILFSMDPYEGWRMGSTIELYDTNAGKHLGEYMIVGVKHGPSGESAGQIPDRMIKACLAI